MSEAQLITGAEKLTSVFGYWPSFHDAEIVWIKIDRSAGSDSDDRGPTLDTLIHAFEMTKEIDSNGYYCLRNHVLVHLRFHEAVELSLEGFNHQNVLMELTISDLTERQLERVRWRVHFASSWGVESTFNCYHAEVISVTPCDKHGTALPEW